MPWDAARCDGLVRETWRRYMGRCQIREIRNQRLVSRLTSRANWLLESAGRCTRGGCSVWNGRDDAGGSGAPLLSGLGRAPSGRKRKYKSRYSITVFNPDCPARTLSIGSAHESRSCNRTASRQLAAYCPAGDDGKIVRSVNYVGAIAWNHPGYPGAWIFLVPALQTN